MTVDMKKLWTMTGAIAPSAVVMAMASIAQAQDAAFSIPAGPLNRSLTLLASQSGERVLYDAELVAGVAAPAVQGRMTTDRAAAVLLAGSGLTAERTASRVLIVKRLTRAEAAEVVAHVEDVVVTGSLIRGVSDGPSPVVVVSRDAIDRSGYASVAQALQALPQNFAGTANEATLPSGTDLSGVNGSFASGVNLRGLGSDATLVLVNGRRMAGSGAKADFSDISTLPTAIVDRVEILLDGASALYGSDAVGGVVNVVLKTDFEGAETRLRAGGTTDGPAGEFGVGQTLGRRWSSGGFLFSYEYLDREALPVSARPRAGNADLRPFGGTDHRGFYSSPGNLVEYDPAVGNYVVTHAIRGGRNGAPMTAGDFLPDQINRDNYLESTNVLGRQIRHSVFTAFDQSIGDRLTVSGDLRYGRRTWDTVGGSESTILYVDTSNPFFVSPTGAMSQEIAYSFRNDIGNTRSRGEAESLGASLGGAFALAGDWKASGYVAYARDSSDGVTSRQVNSAFLNEALGLSPDDPATAYRASRDGYFNPYGDGEANTSVIADFIGSGRSRSVLESEVTTINLQVDGTVWRLPGGDARVAIGLNGRREAQTQGGEVFTYTTTPVTRADRRSERDVTAAFLEARIPLFGPDNRRPGLERLEISVAGRYEDYDDIGSTTNPKVGLLWAPVQDVIVRASYGTSFRAPALVELNDSPINAPSALPEGAAQTVTLIQYGGNADLRPEEATSWTAGLEYRPKARPGLRLAANWFRTAYDGRIGRPALDNIFDALNDPSLAPFVRRIAPATNAADRAYLQTLLDSPDTFSGNLFPVASYGAVLDARWVNTSRLEVEGIDLSGSWAFSRGRDAFNLGGTVSHLLRYETQATPSSPVFDRVDTPNNPVGLRGRASADWSRGSWGAGVTVNYVGDYHAADGRQIDAWTTADVQVRYAPDEGRFSGLITTLIVRNLFDQDPPFYDAPQGIAYDAANTDVLGRFVALQISRRW